MNSAYWDSVAADYEERVLSVYDNDREGLVLRCIEETAALFPHGRAADLGCGIGNFTAELASRFSEVEACDFSATFLEIARRRCAAFPQTRFWQVDLANDPMPFDPVELVLAINVLIMPDLDQRLRAWRATANQVAFGGVLIVVAPSLESAQLSFYRDVEERLDSGDSCEAALRGSLCRDATAHELQQGVRRLGPQRVKHYLQQELEGMLRERGFEAVEMRRLNYPEGLAGVPDGSWDWLATAKRRR